MDTWRQTMGSASTLLKFVLPTPTDKAAVQRLLGVAQYLIKFLPHLLDITKPLRELTKSDVLWFLGDTQQTALDRPKEAVTSTPVPFTTT